MKRAAPEGCCSSCRKTGTKLDELAKYLYEKETITGDEFMALLNAK